MGRKLTNVNLAAADKGKPGINHHANMKFSFRHIQGLLILTAAVLVYYPALFTFFSQDDFTHLLISRANNFPQLLKFFIPYKHAIYYRPLSIQLYTWLSANLFGLNPKGFHAIALGFHLVNIWLVYKLLFRLSGYKRLSGLAAFIYGVHPSHFMSLFWIAEFSMVLAPFFAFLACLSFMEKKYFRFWLWTVMGLISNELTAAVPLILAGWLMVRRKLKQEIKYLWPALAAVAGLVTLRFVVFPASLGSEYLLTFKLETLLANIRWHVFRAIGLPEGFRGQLELMETKLALMLMVVLGLFWLNLRRKLKTEDKPWAGFGLYWFLAALLPVLFLSHHQSPIYQIIGLPGFLLAALLPIKAGLKMLPKRLLFASLFLLASFWAVRAQANYHWVTKRARLAEYHLEKLQLNQANGADMVVFLNTQPESSKEVYLALGGANAVKVFFSDKIGVLFEDFDEPVIKEGVVYIFSRVF